MINNILQHFYEIDCLAEQSHHSWGDHKAKNESTSKAHTFLEPVIICLGILENESKNKVPGDILEFGCYTGISSAKLSIIAKIINKKLYVFDSFEGLPEIDSSASEIHKSIYQKGQYSCSLDTVKKNVSQYGVIKNTEFVKGYFESTLKNYSKIEKIAYTFIDVDLVQSLEECLDFVLPLLQKDGIIFSHEAKDPDYLPIFEKYGLLKKEQYYSEGVGNGIDNTNVCFFKKLK